jgi:di/tricarboxylate transporter
MTWEAWLTVGLIAAMIVALVRNWGPPDLVLLGVLTILTTTGALTHSDKLPHAEDALKSFGNEALITVGVLFVIAAGLTQTGAMSLVTSPLLGRPKSALSAQLRLMFPVAGLSAFLNNTPIVAMFMPVVSDWCKKNNLSPSKLFIPLSYATILGGVCSLIGTSTNLVVNGLWTQAGHPSLGMFDVTPVGIPIAVVGLIYLVVFSRVLLKDRKPALSPADDPREYTVEMVVEPGSGLVGQTIEAAGLRHLPGMYLLEIDRDGHILPGVSRRVRLAANDRLVFVGIVDSVIDLQKIRGLKVATDQVFKLDAPRAQRVLIEAVVSNTCPLVNKTIREGRFRSNYNAAVIAVARNGKRLRNTKIGDIVLQPGDTLLLEAHPSFADQQHNSRDFFLVSKVEGATPPRHERAWLSLGILAGMVVIAGFGWMSMLNVSMVAAGLMIVTGCCTPGEARSSVEWYVLLTIGAALGIGKALQTSGAAEVIADRFIGAAHGSPLTALAVVYVVTLIFTELMSHSAAVAIVFPIAMATAVSMGVSPMPFVITLMVAGSCGFASPVAYQTHMMVYGPGDYRISDFTRNGLPLDVLCGVVTVIVTPMVWPF